MWLLILFILSPSQYQWLDLIPCVSRTVRWTWKQTWKKVSPVATAEHVKMLELKIPRSCWEAAKTSKDTLDRLLYQSIRVIILNSSLTLQEYIQHDVLSTSMPCCIHAAASDDEKTRSPWLRIHPRATFVLFCFFANFSWRRARESFVEKKTRIKQSQPAASWQHFWDWESSLPDYSS